jgi:hypothetical protein
MCTTNPSPSKPSSALLSSSSKSELPLSTIFFTSTVATFGLTRRNKYQQGMPDDDFGKRLRPHTNTPAHVEGIVIKNAADEEDEDEVEEEQYLDANKGWGPSSTVSEEEKTKLYYRYLYLSYY